MARKDSGTVNIEVQAPRTLMHEIMRTAMEAGYTYGIGYWAMEEGNSVKLAETDGLFPVSLRFSFRNAYPIQKAGGVPTQTHLRAVIDERDIARAIGRALSVSDMGEYADKNAAASATQILQGDLDGPSADVIVQLAVFNEVIYG